MHKESTCAWVYKLVKTRERSAKAKSPKVWTVRKTRMIIEKSPFYNWEKKRVIMIKERKRKWDITNKHK